MQAIKTQYIDNVSALFLIWNTTRYQYFMLDAREYNAC